MPTINDSIVHVNDTVFDIAIGTGTVVATTFGDITVKFKNGSRITYDSTGHYGGVRRLFWHNPVFLDPPKDKSLWETLATCSFAIHQHLKK